MDQKFTIICLTPPDTSPKEGERVTKILESGVVDYVHLRHPEATRDELEDIITSIPAHLHPKIRIHNHFDLLDEYNLAGAHLNNKCSTSNAKDVKSLTKSCHSLFELWNIDSFDYVTLSPIYESISKQGYVGRFSRTALSMALKGKRVVALGGVSPDKFKQLRKSGFIGAGMLGYIWQEEFMRSLRQIKMFKNGGFGLQYVTNKPTPEEVYDEVKGVIDGGCRWVQIRMKEADEATIKRTVDLVAPLCKEHNTLLLLDDRVELAAELDNVDGVHIGKEDMPPEEARKLLGEYKIIGCSANTFEDIVEINKLGVADYIELGPWRVNQTKRKEAPTLGFEISLEIFNKLHEWLIDIPITVIGGVIHKDVKKLKGLGAQGVTVGGSIRNAPDPTKSTAIFVSEING